MKKGFTLVELMIVMSIIGTLSGIVVSNTNDTRSKARDAKRVEDLRQVQIAMELFHDTYGHYPMVAVGRAWEDAWNNLSTCLETGAGCGIAGRESAQVFMSEVPQDPQDDSGTVSDSDPTYYYGYPSCGQGYVVAALLENDHSVLRNDIDGGFYNNANGCEDSIKGYCIGAGDCVGR